MLLGTTKIEPGERKALVRTAGVVAVIGLGGGIMLGTRLDGDVVVTGGFWTALLGVMALSALPLVAASTQIARLLMESDTPEWDSKATPVMVVAASLSLLEIVLCLYQIGVTPSGGSNPADNVVYVTTGLAGLTLAAVIVTVAAAVLDKIDSPPAEGDGGDCPKPPAPTPPPGAP